MTKKSRTILFSVCVFLFLIIASVSVLYSQGYRFDFTNRKITQTGGLFLKVFPKLSNVYINGELQKRTDFFFNSALIENLLPQKYKIEVKKDGYQTWQKILEIREKEVTEAKFITLFPEKFNFTTLSEGIENFWISPDGKKIILKENENNGWALKVYDPNRNIRSFLVAEKNINKNGAELLSLEFSPDSSQIYLDAGVDEQIKSFAINYNESSPVLTKKATTTVPADVVSYKKTGNDLYYLNNAGYVLKSDSLFSGGEKINDIPFAIQGETEYRLEILAGKLFIKENQILYSLDTDSKSFEKIFEPIKDLKISSDSSKIVLFSENEIWLLLIRDSEENIGKKLGEKIFLTRFSEKIGDIFWLNPYYLIFNAGNNIKIAETDDRDKINIYDAGSFSDPKMFFNQADNKIYIHAEKKLISSQNLIQ